MRLLTDGRHADCYIPQTYPSGDKNIPKGLWLTERTQNLFQIKQRVISPKVRKPELSTLYATCHLILIYISIKYHQNIPKGIQVTERTRSFTPTSTLMPERQRDPSQKTICTHAPPPLVGERGT